MKIIFYILCLFFSVYVKSQIKTDTIFSGKEFYVNFENSLINLVNRDVVKLEFCDNVEKVNSKYKNISIQDQGYSKAQVPFLLNDFNLKVKSNIFTDFDALIFSSYLDTGTFLTETYLLEFYYESEEKALLCMRKIAELIKIRKEIEKHDIEPTVGSLNLFFHRKDNRVYLIYSLQNQNNSSCNSVQLIKNVLMGLMNPR